MMGLYHMSENMNVNGMSGLRLQMKPGGAAVRSVLC